MGSRWRICPTEGWAGFAAWAGPGALLGLSVVGAASIGLFVLPVAVLSMAVVGWTVRVWPEIAGLLAGMAALSLLVGVANLGSTPCPATGSGSVHAGGAGATTSSCGGLDPWPWLAGGLVLAGLGVAVYVWARPRP